MNVPPIIIGYMSAVNKHYRNNQCQEPFDSKGESNMAVLLQAQGKFEHEQSRRAPLTNQMIVKMCELAKQDPLGFQVCAWDIVGMGYFGGYQHQEYAMDPRTEVKYYVRPDGTCVVRAFTMKKIIFYDGDNVILGKPLLNRKGVKKMG